MMKKLLDMLSLKGKVAFVTGGAGYLGTAMCEVLAEMGAHVVVVSRDGTKCTALAERLTAEYGVRAMGLGVNIREPEEIRQALKQTVDTFGRLDILINNAWSGTTNSFDSISYEHWERDLNMGLTAVFATVKEAVEYLKQTQGVILNTASMYGHVAPDYRIYDGLHLVNPPSYGAAKAGVIQLTKYLASFLSPHRIRVNAVSPGPFPFPQVAENNPAFLATLEGKNMLGRVGQPADLKGVTALLCSEAGAYITGQNYAVDGGWTAW